ncbi:MAG: hypothetical protein A3G49_03185 [Candidatus Sungbacteria bacterium RIFCSPLOWO2_12_FULL_41_11]|uniref:Uncharacterized protein n=1 Tax=Candidatus Sungbacteria bacterium RIFCSPLOWO2_12_FULL_41_11 TaxID=1802286 RepID=A0A1G2LRF7_9BACT|nr:MAG: hypothetical protein UV01_C0001G0139 [Parcubacteria group bacterium GW2011_GWA2_42_14]OGZ98068.1 MAG: hypothetical protein A3D41_05230 [Candidatus Sungbacteria bacterium RIFCSPHIGHO2_02_FULL_41_12b]OHA14216.1 MAG: hypothetical protein A3G49_03185 [Candidatus Sungbacteria bacterium RIFCSPLOWO2_12_FULL_41_11]
MNEEEQQQFEELEEERTHNEYFGELKEIGGIIATAREHQIKSAFQLAGHLNSLIKEGHVTTAFLIALALAGAKDGWDWTFGKIPIVGLIGGTCISLALFLFLWGKGMFKKGKIKMARLILVLFFDNIPLIKNLPTNTLMVLYAWHVVKKRAREAEEKLKDLQEKTGQTLEGLESEEMELEEEYA